jgi:beta-glucosidase
MCLPFLLTPATVYAAEEVEAPILTFGSNWMTGLPEVSINYPSIVTEADAARVTFAYTLDGRDPTIDAYDGTAQASFMTWGAFGVVIPASVPISGVCLVKVIAIIDGAASDVAGILASTLGFTVDEGSGVRDKSAYPLEIALNLNDPDYLNDVKEAYYFVEERDTIEGGTLVDSSVTLTSGSALAAEAEKYELGSPITVTAPGTEKATVVQILAIVEILGDLYPLEALYYYTAIDGIVMLQKDNAAQVVREMFLSDKINLLSGVGAAVANLANTGVAGATLPLPAYGIPGISLSDGPTGVRMGFNSTVWTNPTGISATWNTALANAIARRVGVEASAYGVDYMLGPALNIQRNPLGGRDFEYYSEDPLLSGKTAASYTIGLQSQGIGATLKHYAVNNQEQYRSGGIQKVSERALREIYLRGFEIAVTEGVPWSVMSSYNRPNGKYASANTWLLTDVLRGDWGFDGFVMTDWGGAHNVPEDNWVEAQNDLAMPSGNLEQVRAWLNDDNSADGFTYEEKVAMIDRNVENILNSIVKTHTFNGDYAELTSSDIAELSGDFWNTELYKESDEINRATAAEGMVLLKNEAQALPLPANKTVSIVNVSSFGGGGMFGIGGGSGVYYQDMMVEGGGSAQVTWDAAYVVDFKKGFENAGYTVYDEYLSNGTQTGAAPDITAITAAQANQMAANSDYGVFIISRPSSEGADNVQSSFDMSAAEAESYNALTEAFHAVGKKVIALINSGAAINVQEFKESADAVLVTWLPGNEGGNATLDILTGKVNPSGKLTQTFPLEYNDSPSIAMAKHEDLTWSSDPEYYDEGVYVGYRYFTTFGKEDRVAYPFGYGLSYTTFSFSDLKLDKNLFPEGNDSETLTAAVTVTNTGTTAGKEVVELYLGADSYVEEGRPIRELKAYGKTGSLLPGESETIELTITKRDLQYFDDNNPDNDLDSEIVYQTESDSRWTVESGTVFTLSVGSSSATDALETNGVSDTFVYGGPAIQQAAVLTKDGNGTVSGQGQYDKGSSVTVTAVPAGGYTFKGWYDADGNLVSSAAEYTFTITSDISLKAVFEEAAADTTPTPTPTSIPLRAAKGYSTSPAQPPTEQPEAPASISSLAEYRGVAVSLAQELYKLNLFVGTGVNSDGTPVFELERPLNRLEALALVIRLLGAEKAANAYTGSNPFTDIPSWGDRYAAYAYSIGLTAGINDAHTLFAADRNVTSQEFTAFLLRTLGYTEQNGDFVYANALSKAISAGLYTEKESQWISGSSAYLRSDAAAAVTDALLSATKGTGTELVNKLAADGVLTQKQASDFVTAVNKVYTR